MKNIIIFSTLCVIGIMSFFVYNNYFFDGKVSDTSQQKTPHNFDKKEGKRVKNEKELHHAVQQQNEDIIDESVKEMQEDTMISVPFIFGTGNVGCGVGIKFVSYKVEHTQSVLDIVYRKLFDSGLEISPEYRNPILSYEFLMYDSVVLSNGNARVYLSGDMRGPGHCTLPEIRALIDEAAFQFDTVDTVTVYLNGEIYDWCEKDLSDGETGCPAKKKLWIDRKDK
ncbi:MAG: hypothetical protein CR972_03615 [Candidatus Moraniibacteriota bacterium]|nr:MAG: hypothetical protein CR972_03615 [Candidatus Moranbacteria bacterium]